MKRLAPVLPVVICAVVAISAPPAAASNPYEIAIVDQDLAGTGTIQGYTEVQPGEQATMCVWVDPANGLDSREGGFDFLICYESDAMSVVTVEPGFSLHPEWEYFTYSLGGVADTCPMCPPGFLRVVGIADINNGVMPDDSVFNLAGCIAEITLAASADPANVNDCHTVGFCSLECGDNVIAPQHGDSLFLPSGGVVFGPNYDSLVCLAAGTNVPYATYTAGELCILDSIPDTVVTDPYRVAVVDRDIWINSDTAIGITTAGPGDQATMCVWVDPSSGLNSVQEGGFDFLVCYEDDALAAQNVTPGSDLHPEWEYFTYRLGLLGDSCGYCPGGFLRVVGVADVNNGVTPSDSVFQLAGCVAEVTFAVSSDPAWYNTQHTVGFCSLDCGDNAIASRSGDTLFVPLSGVIHGPEFDTLACHTDSMAIPFIHFTAGTVRILGDSSSTSMYDVAMIDMNRWVTQNIADPYTYVSGGHNASMCLWVDPASGSSQDDGGFDMLVCYDDTRLTFLNAYRGPDLHAEWEYFTWRAHSSYGDSCGVCPQGFLRVVGIADLVDGVTPAAEAFELSGCIARVDFYVSGAAEHAGTCADVGFCALDCGDNVIANRIGDTIYLPQSGYTPGPFYDPAMCDSSSQGLAIPAIAFTGGHVCIDSSQSVRGDVNLNGIPYEIGDAVLMANYMIYGLVVLHPINYETQIIAMDINCDGISGTIADLIYLLNIITGERLPCDDVPPDSLVTPAAAASAGLILSDDDTLRVVSTTAAPGETFTLDIYLSNRDTLGAYSARLTYDPAVLEPVIIDTIVNGADTAYGVMLELVTGSASFEVAGAGTSEEGVITLLVSDFDPGIGTPYLPGGAIAVRLSLRALPSAAGGATPVSFENDPIFPNSWNTLTDIRAEIWKRPVLIDGTVTINGPVFSTDDTLGVVSTSVAAGEMFPVDITLTNVDTLGAYAGRIRFDDALIEPVRDSANEVVVELVRGASVWESFGAGEPEPGVLTFAAVDFNQDTLNLFGPGTGVDLRIWCRVLPSAAPQVTALVYENHPVDPYSWNTFTDIRAEIFKRPTLTNGTVEITEPECYCPYQGDMDIDGYYTTVDLALYIDCLFACSIPPQDEFCPSDRLDLDCDGFGTSLDLAWLIDHLFDSGPPPCDPCNP